MTFRNSTAEKWKSIMIETRPQTTHELKLMLQNDKTRASYAKLNKYYVSRNIPEFYKCYPIRINNQFILRLILFKNNER